MKELREFYKRWMIGLSVPIVLLCIHVAGMIPNIISAYGETSWIVNLLNFLISRLPILGILTGLHFIVNNWLWTIRIIGKPELDFRGVWEGETTYNEIYLSKINRELPFSTPHIVKIKQSCFNIELTPTRSKEFVNWGSLAVNLSDDHTIQYAYWVNYTNIEIFPREAKGYEELKAIDYKKGKPIELSGNFYHCTEGQKPTYSGFVNFKRKTYKN